MLIESILEKDMESSRAPISPARTVAVAILEQLQLWGVQRIYGVAGDAIFGLLDAVGGQSAIRFVSVKHESAAALMASAEAKYTGGISVCAAQMGPGLANLLNGLGDAYMDGASVLAITGQAPLPKIGTHYKQYVNQQQMVQAVTDYSELVTHPDAAIPCVSRAIHVAMTLKTVSHLSIPADVFGMPTSARPFPPVCVPQGGGPGDEEIEDAAQMLRQAERPMMLVGHDARSAEGPIQRLAETWGCGIAIGYGATGVIPADSRHMLGGLGEGGNPYLTGRFKEADAVLIVGTSWWPDGMTPAGARIVQIADRPMSLGQGIPVDYCLVGKIGEIVGRLEGTLRNCAAGSGWMSQIRQCRETWAGQNEQEGKADGFPLHPSRIVRAVERHAAPDAIIALDEGDSTLWFMRNFRAKRQCILQSSRWRTMGFGLPAAMAASLCCPEQPVLCITGDGGLAMVLADMLTAARYRLRVIVILFNNGALQMERNKMEKKGLTPEGTDITNPDFVRLAEACGWDAWRIQSADDLERRLQAALAGVNPTLLDVPTAPILFPQYQS
jgi:pyruvate dehydrogenase (quinone)/pyruvate oxidase